MTLKVPLTGTNVTPEGPGPQPGATPTPAPPTEAPAQPTGRPSLHQARIPRPPAQQQEVRAEFNNFGRVKWVPVEQEPAQADAVADVDNSTPDAGGGAQAGDVDVPPQDIPVTPPTAQTFDGLQQQMQQMQRTIELLAQAQLRGMQPELQKPAAPQPPDPTQFDFYDAASTAEFHRLNNAYIQATVRHEVSAALEPHGAALQDAQLNAQYNALAFQHGQEANFKERMGAALRLMTKLPGVTMSQAFDAADGFLPTTSPQKAAAPSPSAKPAQRTITAEEAAQKAAQAKRLPASNGVGGAGRPSLPSHIKTLGAIMAWNQQNGRAN